MPIDPLFGLGMSVVFGFGRWLFPAVPRTIAITGFAAGIIILMIGLTPGSFRPPLSSLILATVGALAFAGAGHLYWSHIVSGKEPSKLGNAPAPSPSPPLPLAIGGAGGAAVVNGSGIAIGGHGGRVTGSSGIGGAGGSAEVTGDGHAAGGAGGSVGSERYWPAPAKSGYEVHQRALGLPVDPAIRSYWRGGAVPGYEPKLATIEELRAAFFEKYRLAPKTIFQDINAVPLEYLNKRLEANGAPWRVKVVDDEYEFFLP